MVVICIPHICVFDCTT